MPNPQSSTEGQNEIRNASERVVVVAARFALVAAYGALPVHVQASVPGDLQWSAVLDCAMSGSSETKK